jgi:septal ring factor EnvC (AmiA/AmiB activator)
MGLKILLDILLKDTETMTDERFNHLEAQITELRELLCQSITAAQQNTEIVQKNVTVMQQNTEAMQQNAIGMQQNVTAMQQNVTAMQQDLNSMREDMTALRERVDLIEDTVTIKIREGFNSLRNHLDDLSLEQSGNNRNTFDEDLNRHRLNRRIPTFDKREDD